MATEWYVHIGSTDHGPISSDALRQLARESKVTPNTLLKRVRRATGSRRHV